MWFWLPVSLAAARGWRRLQVLGVSDSAGAFLFPLCEDTGKARCADRQPCLQPRKNLRRQIGYEIFMVAAIIVLDIFNLICYGTQFGCRAGIRRRERKTGIFSMARGFSRCCTKTRELRPATNPSGKFFQLKINELVRGSTRKKRGPQKCRYFSRC